MGPPDVIQLLHDLEAGREDAFDRLLVEVYPELRAMARGKLRGQAGQTLNPTGLVHEAYLKLVRYQDVSWKGRAHFFGAASQAMRRILVDRARSRAAQKRQGDAVALSHARPAAEGVPLSELIDLDDALNRMAEQRPRWVRVVECRYFGGLTLEETAEALNVSHGTVSNDWRLARAWLKREL